ncbi:allophanate hydrolase, partial [Pseudomonas syringae]|nr:allophanate hydrolase [Pseudomonas syringae]
EAPRLPAPQSTARNDMARLVVCGAHLDGLALNWQLRQRGARLLETTQSSADYRLYALAGGPPFRPGMVRVAEQGVAIDVEVWELPSVELGSFLTGIPAPLGLGKVQLADGRWETGFICEAYGLEGARDISHLGGWRAHLQQQ